MKFRYFMLFSLLFIVACSTSNKKIQINHKIQQHQLKIKINPGEHLLKIEDILSFQSKVPQNQFTFLINKNIKIDTAQFEGQSINLEINKNFNLQSYVKNIDETTQKEFKEAAELIITLPNPVQKGRLKLNYQLVATDSVDRAAFSREYIAYQVNGYIGKKGVFVSPSYFWYPALPKDLANFHLQVTCPDSFNIITQGKLESETQDKGLRTVTWVVDYPAEGLHLVGSKYVIKKTKYKDIDIYTYFFPETQDLADSYLSACKRYLAMYEEMIGPYPFTKFAVVENFFPTGYGMPSYTLLGSQVIRLPFIIHTSLGHEIAHSWWGNSVYVDYDEGNWCEGLTSYYADYHYKELQGKDQAISYRRDLNRDYTVYVNPETEFPLSKFRERTGNASRAIGYGKSTMVFHQLHLMLGNSRFRRVFKYFYETYKFKRASWSDIEASVEKITNKDFSWFFEQWVQRKGAPEFRLKSKRYNDYLLQLKFEQSKPIYKIMLPIIIHTHGGDFRRVLFLREKEQVFAITLAWKPRKISIDPEFDVFRRLDRREIPPTLSEIFAKDNAILVLPDKCSNERLQLYQQIAQQIIKSTGKFSLKRIPDLTSEELNSASFFILGDYSENSLFKRLNLSSHEEVQFKNNEIFLNENQAPLPNEVLVLAFRDKANTERNYCSISIGRNGKIGRVGSLLKHYGKYSYLIFTNGKNIIKDVYLTTENPMVVDF